MKFKLDENFGLRTKQVFVASGHDVETVYDERLSGASDQEIMTVCIHEGRCLVTLDLDFSDVLRFPPERTAGIVVVRLLRNPTTQLLESLIQHLLKQISINSIEGKLWILEPGRLRIHQSSQNED